jgi:S1-C subfamily serine protease
VIFGVLSNSLRKNLSSASLASIIALTSAGAAPEAVTRVEHGETTVTQAPPSATTPIDDDAIVDHIELLGTALVHAKGTVTIKTLRSQLEHAHTCSIKLPESSSETLSPTDLYQRRADGVLVVGMLAKVKKGKKVRYELAGCSGFALTADGIFVTNYHVVDNPEAETMVVMSRDGVVTPATEVLAADKLADVAILRAPGATFTPIPLAPDVPPPGSPIWVISHPAHNFYSLTTGAVSRHLIVASKAGKTPQMAITADFGIGSSGGPILDSHGEVTGIVCSTTSVYWQDERTRDLQMVFKHCVPVNSIRSLIQAAKQ